MVSQSGAFSLQVKNTVPQSLFSLRIDRLDSNLSEQLILINDFPNIQVSANVNDITAYSVKGSPASDSLKSFFNYYKQAFESIDNLNDSIEEIEKNNKNTDIIKTLQNNRNQEITVINNYIKEFIKNNNSPAAIFYALGVGMNTMPPDSIKSIMTEALIRFPKSKAITTFQTLFNNLMQNVQNQASNTSYPLLNKLAPEIALPNPNGDTIRLSSYRGKYVLVDFWASWCNPCRHENPNVVKAYKKFHSKKFDILGVSLDDDKADWIEATKEDHLTWTQVSDLKKWNTPLVSIYQFDAIPFNVLIDPNGIIIASELRGDDLEEKLSEVLK